jgi:hypothetical protein
VKTEGYGLCGQKRRAPHEIRKAEENFTGNNPPCTDYRATIRRIGAAAGAACGESAAPLNRRHWRINSIRTAPFAAAGKLRFA